MAQDEHTYQVNMWAAYFRYNWEQLSTSSQPTYKYHHQ